MISYNNARWKPEINESIFVIITTEIKFYRSVECSSVWFDIYWTTFRRKYFQVFSFVKLNFSCSQCNLDVDTADGNIQMYLLELQCDAVVKYKFSDIECQILVSNYL